MKVQIVDNPKEVTKHWSTRFIALAGVLMAIAEGLLHHAISYFAFLPDDFRASVPAEWLRYAAIAATVAAAISKFIDQRNLESGRANAGMGRESQRDIPPPRVLDR